MEFQHRQLMSLWDLEGHLSNSTASAFQQSLRHFQQSLRQFITQVPHAEVDQLSSFHSVTTVFEFFTAYLIIRSCRVAVLIPESWIHIHLPWFAHSLLTRETSNDDDLRSYAGSLFELTDCYCQLLSRLGPVRGRSFRLGSSHYPSRVLHQRNIELLALVVVNLGFSCSEVKGFKEVWRSVSQVRETFPGQPMQLTLKLGFLLH